MVLSTTRPQATHDGLAVSSAVDDDVLDLHVLVSQAALSTVYHDGAVRRAVLLVHLDGVSEAGHVFATDGDGDDGAVRRVSLLVDESLRLVSGRAAVQGDDDAAAIMHRLHVEGLSVGERGLSAEALRSDGVHVLDLGGVAVVGEVLVELLSRHADTVIDDLEHLIERGRRVDFHGVRVEASSGGERGSVKRVGHGLAHGGHDRVAVEVRQLLDDVLLHFLAEAHDVSAYRSAHEVHGVVSSVRLIALGEYHASVLPYVVSLAYVRC